MTPSQNFALFCRSFLTHTKGTMGGQPLILDRWQMRDIIRPLLDTRLADKRRQYRKCFTLVPRKNGKTTLAAAIALYFLFADDEPGAEIISAAADSDQAAIAFDIAKKMVQSSPQLSAKCKVYRRYIEANRGANYKVIAADAAGNLGQNTSTLILDEVLAQKDSSLYEALLTGMAARSQPLAFMISTAGTDRSSLCYNLFDYAQKVRDGVVIDKAFLPVLYGTGDDDDWKDEQVWAKANPGIGKSISLEYLRSAAIEAVNNPARETAFRQYHLNQWVQSSARWISSSKWAECEDHPNNLQEIPCYAALDLSSRTDLTAFVLAFPVADKIHLKTYTWTTSGMVISRAKSNRMRYEEFVRGGSLEVIQGDVIDYEHILRRIWEIADQFVIREIAIDPWNAEFLAQKLDAAGHNVVEFRQGFASMSPPTKDFEGAVLQGKLTHDGNPVLRWCIDNVVVESDAAGNQKPSKKKSSEKIDCAVAAIMAFARARRADATGNDGASVYESREMLVF